MNWGFDGGCVLRCAICAFVAVTLGVVLQGEQGGFGFARGFERGTHGWIDVITAFDEWHGSSKNVE
jgi:hypothetical protein